MSHHFVLVQVVHVLSPSFNGLLEGTGRVPARFYRGKPSKTRILSFANDIIKVELGSEIPFEVVSVLAANIVCMKGKDRLVWRHPGGPRVEELHGKIELSSGRKGDERFKFESHVVLTMFLIESIWKPRC